MNSMFNRITTTNSTGYNESVDSKYTVAEILSSMTETEQVPITPTTLASGIFSSGSYSGTTPTLTPTTLHNIEQSFMQYSSSPVVSSSNQYNTGALNTEGGFVTPVIEPSHNTPTPVMVIKSEQDDLYYDDSSSRGSDSEYSVGGKRMKREDGYTVPNIDPDTYLVANSRRPTGPRKQRQSDPMSEEDKGKLMQRRQRNKLAAAKCRQRREDHTNKLIQETEGLEEEKATLENEIQTLQQQKDQLEFILQAHRNTCRVAKNGQLVRSTLSNMVVQPTTASFAKPVTVAHSTPSTLLSVNHHTACGSRPSSLPISRTQQLPASVTEVTGIPISTPSQGIAGFSMGLDSLVEGHTGLTPLTGVVPSINLPASCSGDLKKRRSTDSSSSNELSSPSLVTL